MTLIGKCWLSALMGVAAILFAPSARGGDAAKEFLINGPLYKRVVQLKDVVSDILPPPAYIIESHLVVHELLDAVERGADAKTVDDLIEYGRKLKDGCKEFPGYFERLAVWEKDTELQTPAYKEIREWMVIKSQEAAKAYYEARDAKFIPLLKPSDPSKSADLNAAKAALRNELRPLYDRHRAAIDEVVIRSNEMVKKLEREVVTLVSKGDTTQVLIGGTYYNNIIRMKDLVADILPPPRYIIEAHLTNLQMLDAVERGDKAELARLIEWGRQLKEGMSIKKELPGYLERQTYWKANLPEKEESEKKIKDLMTRASCEPALRFFEIRDTQFVPALQKGDLREGKNILHKLLMPAYQEHRRKIDELVSASNASYEALMKDVEAKLKK